RQDIPRRANYLAWVKPARPVPASRVFEVRERIGAGGVVIEPLDEASVEEAAESCRKLGVEAVAVCLLHSFANPAHERKVADILRVRLPGVAVTASSDVLPVVREYERSLATVFNAVVMPGVSTYVSRLEKRLLDEHVIAPLLLMQSNGAGGGSIANVDAGAMTVGPQSAGADPGPAAYGRGGERATVTDAHVILGHLPAKLLGGRMELDVEAAGRIIDREVATPLGLGRETAARGILSILDHNMVGAVRLVSVERGHDPRD